MGFCVVGSSSKNALTTSSTQRPDVDDQHPQHRRRPSVDATPSRRRPRNGAVDAAERVGGPVRPSHAVGRLRSGPERRSKRSPTRCTARTSRRCARRGTPRWPSSSTRRRSSSRRPRRGRSRSARPCRRARTTCALLGASPNHSATCALAHGEAIQSIHSFMQLGLAACDDSIQVSDQPVAPSTGLTASILAPLACGEVDDDLPGGAGEHVPSSSEPADRCSQRPVLTGERLLLLEQRDRRVELRPGRARTGW